MLHMEMICRDVSVQVPYRLLNTGRNCYSAM